MRVSYLVPFSVALPLACWSQTGAASDLGPAAPLRGAVRVEGVSVYSSYYTSGSPSGFEAPISNAFLPGPSASSGAAVTIGGSTEGEKGSLFWNYSPSYFNLYYGNNQFQNNGSINHRASLNWSRKLGGSNKWTLNASANGLMANLEQLYFSAGVLESVASMPTNFDDLASAMLAGKFNDAQLASLLTGAPVQASPQQSYLYGRRVMSAAASLGLSWTPTGRTSFSLVATGTRSQSADGIGTAGGQTTQSTSAVPQTTEAGLALSWSYSVTPRTQIGLVASSRRTFSQLEEGYASSGALSFGRTMSRRWFMEMRAGAGELTYSRQVIATPKTFQHIYGGSLGWKTSSQTLLASYDRSLGDVYGLGSNTTESATGTWTWRPMGSSWSASVNGGFQEFSNTTLINTRAWQASGGVARGVGTHVFVSIRYVYMQLPANLAKAGVRRTQNGLTTALTWSPARYQ